jgi:hypothetical protein
MLTEGHVQVGAKALRGEEEFIPRKIFPAVSFDRHVRGKCKLIQVYHPKKDSSSPAYWEYEDEHNHETGFVSKEHEVRVIKAHVFFIQPASGVPP